MPLTKEQRAAINRANAQHSTGPRTPEGKARSRFNAFRHGLTGQHMKIHPDDLEAYFTHHENTIRAYRPVGPKEIDLTAKLAESSWLINHAYALEVNARAYASLSMITTAERDYFACIDPVTPNGKTPSDDPFAVVDANAVDCADYFHNLHPIIPEKGGKTPAPVGKHSTEWIGRHRYRLERSFRQYIADLKILQKERFSLTAQIRELRAKHGDAYDPAIHGPFHDDVYNAQTCEAIRALRKTRFDVADGAELLDSLIWAQMNFNGTEPKYSGIDVRWYDPTRPDDPYGSGPYSGRSKEQFDADEKAKRDAEIAALPPGTLPKHRNPTSAFLPRPTKAEPKVKNEAKPHEVKRVCAHPFDPASNPTETKKQSQPPIAARPRRSAHSRFGYRPLQPGRPGYLPPTPKTKVKNEANPFGNRALRR